MEQECVGCGHARAFHGNHSVRTDLAFSDSCDALIGADGDAFIVCGCVFFEDGAHKEDNEAATRLLEEVFGPSST